MNLRETAQKLLRDGASESEVMTVLMVSHHLPFTAAQNLMHDLPLERDPRRVSSRPDPHVDRSPETGFDYAQRRFRERLAEEQLCRKAKTKGAAPTGGPTVTLANPTGDKYAREVHAMRIAALEAANERLKRFPGSRSSR
jgi:hypothetical protein